MKDKVFILVIAIVMVFSYSWATENRDDMTYTRGHSIEPRTHTADVELGESDCGKIHYVGTAGVDITLPRHKSGCKITVSLTANFASTNITVIAATPDLDTIQGSLTVAYANVACADEDQVNFVNSAEIIGDYVVLLSDGAKWDIIHSRGNGSGGLTCTG